MGKQTYKQANNKTKETCQKGSNFTQHEHPQLKHDKDVATQSLPVLLLSSSCPPSESEEPRNPEFFLLSAKWAGLCSHLWVLLVYSATPIAAITSSPENYLQRVLCWRGRSSITVETISAKKANKKNIIFFSLIVCKQGSFLQSTLGNVVFKVMQGKPDPSISKQIILANKLKSLAFTQLCLKCHGAKT